MQLIKAANLLSVDTSSDCGSIAVLSEGIVLGEIRLANSIQHSERLFRSIEFLFQQVELTLATVCYLRVDAIGPALYALRLLQGVSFAAAFTAAVTLAAELAPRARRAQALGFFGISTLITHAIAPALGEEIVHRAGFPALFTVAAGVSLIAVGCAWSIPGNDPHRRPHGPGGPWRVGRLQRVLAGTMVCCGLAFGAVLTFVPTFIRSSDLGRVGTFFAVYTGAAVLIRIIGGGLSDAVGRRTVILPTLVLLACAVFMLAFVQSVPMLVVAGGVFGLAQGLSYPTLNALAVDLSAEEHLGRVQALFNGAFNLGVTSSAFAFGMIAEQFGYRPMFVTASLTPLAGWLLFYLGTDGMSPNRATTR